MPRRRRKQDPLLDLVPLVVFAFMMVALASQGGLPSALASVVAFTIQLLVIVFAIGVVAFCVKVWISRSRSRQHKEKHRVTERQTVTTENPLRTVTSQPAAKTTRTPAWSMELLRSLEWKRLEELTAELFQATGYRSQETRIGPDGGVDVNLYDRTTGNLMAVVQCKAWNTYPVGIKPIRELYGVMAAEGVAKGIFVTTGRFTSEALAFAKGKAQELIDGDNLLERIQSMEESKQTELARLITRGDYTSPTCPKCGGKMVKRTARKGPNVGAQFWGCSEFPKCRSTLRIRSTPVSGSFRPNRSRGITVV